MKKIIATLAISAALIASPAWAQQVLRLAHNAAPGNPKAEASLKFAELVAQKTNGRIKVEVGGSAQYGDDVEALTNMRLGTLAFSANSQGSTSGVVPQFGVLGLPFLFKDLPQAWKVLDGPVGERLGKHAKEKGLVLLALWDNGIRHVSNNVRPITKPEDLAGVKLRTPPDPITVDIFKSLGANPTPMAYAEVYTGLQTGSIDGQDNPLPNVQNMKFYEVMSQIVLTSHLVGFDLLTVNLKTWSSMSPAQQKAFQAAADKAIAWSTAEHLKREKELADEFRKAGLQIYTPDQNAFRAHAQKVYLASDEAKEWPKGMLEKINALK
jgi:tripartite ATP-independent transporter DctP family solute receptor